MIDFGKVFFINKNSFLDVSVKVVFSVFVICRNHLRKINERNIPVFSYEQVKLVQIAMDEPMSSETNDKGHQLIINLRWLVDFFDLAQGVAGAQLHYHYVSVAIDSFWDGEFAIVQR